MGELEVETIKKPEEKRMAPSQKPEQKMMAPPQSTKPKFPAPRTEISSRSREEYAGPARKSPPLPAPRPAGYVHPAVKAAQRPTPGAQRESLRESLRERPTP